ncbi:MAG: hypothetical protein PHP64_06110 [Actinomycetota bacterium]|nr:hypothetical protein [Actinomycetota bacterium]
MFQPASAGNPKDSRKLRIPAFCLALLVITTLLISTSGCERELPFGQLSFKKFTIEQLLSLNVEIDAAHSGKTIESKRYNEIEQRVSSLRELSIKKPVRFIEAGENIIRAILIQEQLNEESSRETEVAQKMMVALGLFPQNKSLEETLLDTLTEQIAGSYNDEAKVITVVAGKGAGSSMDSITMAHELTHALQDEHFHLDKPPLKNDDYNSDTELAITSLVEGDATNTMYEYTQKYLSFAQLKNVAEESQAMSSEELESAPRYVRESLLFPYGKGLEFVQAIKSRKGIKGLNACYRNPPLSSEQIMHPEKYLSGQDNPIPVNLPDISSSLGKDWKLLKTEILGEFDVAVWFEEFCGLLDSQEASSGWGGNAIQYYENKNKKGAVVNFFTWDSEQDAREFFRLYKNLIKNRFKSSLKHLGSSDSFYTYKSPAWFLYCGISGKTTLALQTPDLKTLRSAIENFPEFTR